MNFSGKVESWENPRKLQVRENDWGLRESFVGDFEVACLTISLNITGEFLGRFTTKAAELPSGIFGCSILMLKESGVLQLDIKLYTENLEIGNNDSDNIGIIRNKLNDVR